MRQPPLTECSREKSNDIEVGDPQVPTVIMLDQRYSCVAYAAVQEILMMLLVLHDLAWVVALDVAPPSATSSLLRNSVAYWFASLFL